MAKSKLMYEEIRKKRLEENKKRMEELNLKRLSHNLTVKSFKPSPSPVSICVSAYEMPAYIDADNVHAEQGKPRIPRLPVRLTPLRRSTRVADKPPVSYKEVPVEPLERLRRGHSYQRRDLLNRVYASEEVRAYAIDRAEQLQSGLEPAFPTFVKPMLQSHVTGGFWLGLPVLFCKANLPFHDETITLEDENEDLFHTKYLAEKTGLSGGWRGFAIHHELVDGDALVFQLLNTTCFKVYIVRAYELEDNQEKESHEAKERDLDATPLDSIAKRTRSRRR